MTMLVNERREHAMTVADYEARIWLYKEQIGTGYIGIGRTLNEAKAAGVVPHGEWEAWATATTGLSIRNVQRCMQAANEIRDGSEMARLEMSKALLLLSSGLDEERREEMARRAADEGSSLRQMQEEIKQLKLQVVKETGVATEMRQELRRAKEHAEEGKAEEIRRLTAERDRAIESSQLQVEKLKELEKQLYQVRDELARTDQCFKNQTQAVKAEARAKARLQAQLREMELHPKTVEVEPEDYADLKSAVKTLRAQLMDAEAAVEAAEARAMGAPAAAADEYGDDTVTPSGFVEACNEFMSRVQFYPFHREDLAAIGDSGRRSMTIFAQGIQSWAGRMLDALACAGGQVDCGGAVSADV